MIPAKVTIWRANLEQDLDTLREVIEPKLRAALQGLNVEAVTFRKKQAKSIHQKLQSGKIVEANGIRDLLGFTVVVLYRHEIPSAIELLKASELAVDDPGPIEVGPSDFRYHEPKVFVRPPAAYLERHPLLVQECEVQFTTVLQHALDVATHDFDYKGRNYSWSNFRLVAQMRGILEMIDRTIDDIDAIVLPEDLTVATPQPMLEAGSVLEVLEAHFAEKLPEDRRRLADTVVGWLHAAELSSDDLNDALTTNTDLVAARSLDPTSAVLGVILRRAPQMVHSYPGRFFISDELRTLCVEAEQVPAERLVGGI
ncbi:hypothetical protein [Microbacterium oleivorans]|uniref:hypothetical protein n=1 Tax=Microbacterium oleivorans TaxID=273677 RepID=UPI00204065F3|nr:hypothetical protein [Microbacterium oleivorans]MCM3695199.1 hypothetical protein [Microbacterium oleivorans]